VLTVGSTVTTRTYAYPSTSNKLTSVTEGSPVRALTHDGAGNVNSDNSCNPLAEGVAVSA
jgi:hypothetical protein